MRSDTADPTGSAASAEPAAPPAAPTTVPRAPRAAPAAVEAAERTFRFDGFAYRCRIVRQGTPDEPPIVLLGGSSQGRHAWLRHEKWLTSRSPLVTVDLPGYGDADFLPARYGIDFLAATVRHLLTELGLPRVHLVGACFGGSVALRFVQHYPQYVARLVLLGFGTVIPAHFGPATLRWERMLARGERARIATELVETFMAPPGTGPVRKREVVARLLYQQFMAQSPEDDRRTVEHDTRLMTHEWYRPEPVPQVPSLVFTGEHDTLFPPEKVREVARVLPAADFVTVKEADHLVPVERMAEFSDLIVRFCSGASLAGLPYCTPVEHHGTRRAAALPAPAPSVGAGARVREHTPA